MAKNKRKYLSKKVRFEVLKRDSFTCQYCGKEAPDVVLNIDHIKPVKDGGSNNMLNLITSCFDCNSGKKAIPLSDSSAVKKQKEQMKVINARREQLDLMIRWRKELEDIGDTELNYAIHILKSKTGFGLSKTGIGKFKKYIKKYGLKLFCDSLDKSIAQYIRYDDDDFATTESVEKIISYTPRICANEIKFKDKPYMNDLYYIRGIMRNKFHYCNEWRMIAALEKAYNNGATIEQLKDMAFFCRNWTCFCESIEENFEVTV